MRAGKLYDPKLEKWLTEDEWKERTRKARADKPDVISSDDEVDELEEDGIYHRADGVLVITNLPPSERYKIEDY